MNKLQPKNEAYKLSSSTDKSHMILPSIRVNKRVFSKHVGFSERVNKK